MSNIINTKHMHKNSVKYCVPSWIIINNIKILVVSLNKNENANQPNEDVNHKNTVVHQVNIENQ